MAKEIAKSAIDKVDTKEELDKTICTISHKVDELGVEKEKIDNPINTCKPYSAADPSPVGQRTLKN